MAMDLLEISEGSGRLIFLCRKRAKSKISEGGTLMQGSCSILPNEGILYLGELYSSTYHSKIFLLLSSFLFWGYPLYTHHGASVARFGGQG